MTPQSLIEEFEKEWITSKGAISWWANTQRGALGLKELILRAYNAGAAAERERIVTVMRERIDHSNFCLDKDCLCGSELPGFQYLVSHLTN